MGQANPEDFVGEQQLAPNLPNHRRRADQLRRVRSRDQQITVANFARTTGLHLVGEALVLMGQEEPWTQAADLENAPFVDPGGDGLALRASSLVDPPQKAPKWHIAIALSEFIDGDVQLSRFPLVEETHGLLLQAGELVDARSFGVEEVSDASLFPHRRQRNPQLLNVWHVNRFMSGTRRNSLEIRSHRPESMKEIPSVEFWAARPRSEVLTGCHIRAHDGRKTN